MCCFLIELRDEDRPEYELDLNLRPKQMLMKSLLPEVDIDLFEKGNEWHNNDLFYFLQSTSNRIKTISLMIVQRNLLE